MLRIFLIVAMVFAAPMQNIVGTDKFSLSEPQISASIDLISKDFLATADRTCCEDAKPPETERTPCKPDCKGVITIAGTVAGDTGQGHGPPRATANVSLANPVDLRPPIS